MSRVEDILERGGRVFLPVIHVESLDQALRNVAVAMEAKADGVFLINHSMGYQELLRIVGVVRKNHPGLWIGVNLLGVPPAEVFGLVTNDIQGVWVDNAEISQSYQQREADRIDQAQTITGWEGLYFGGVAFKGQPEVTDLEFVASRAGQYMNVVTTSGPATGEPAEIEKVITIRNAVQPATSVGIASGITAENVTEYLPFVNCFLVASGISDSWTELNPEKTAELARLIHEAS